MRVKGLRVSEFGQIPNHATLARETMKAQLAARSELVAAAEPHMTLGGYGRATLEVFRQQVIFDARLSTGQELVSVARAQVIRSDNGFHNIDVSLGDHSLVARVHDQDGHLVTDWQTILSLAVVMRCARMRS